MYSELKNSLGFAVNRSAYLIRCLIKKELKQRGYNITPEELILLCCLWENDGLTQNELANYTIKEPSTLTRLLDGMVKKGLVIRKVDRLDKRRVLAKLTNRGKDLKEPMTVIMNHLKNQSFAGIENDEVMDTFSTLTTVQNNIQNRIS